MGSVRTCRALIPEMAARGGAAIVITGSDLVKQPEPGLMDYGAFKAGLLYLTKALAKNVNAAIAPAISLRIREYGRIRSRVNFIHVRKFGAKCDLSLACEKTPRWPKTP
jgi:NAD(P)-dependent dehydrogenase (short-subunit alcohol dehydrogenase family)